jgi:hypothetical protein
MKSAGNCALIWLIPTRSASFPQPRLPTLRRAFDTTGAASFRRKAAEEGGSYLTSESILNIGRYIAITMTPTMAPTRIIISGSTMDVRDWMAASTSSS